MAINEDFALGFKLDNLYERLTTLCPTILTLLHAFSTTAKQKRVSSAQSIEKKRKRVCSSVLDLLGERSQANSYAKHVVGLYLYATGAQRQVISVLNTLGICSSYPTIVGTRQFDPEAIISEPEKSEVAFQDDSETDSDVSVELCEPESEDVPLHAIYQGSQSWLGGQVRREEDVLNRRGNSVKAGEMVVEDEAARSGASSESDAPINNIPHVQRSVNADIGLLWRICLACRATLQKLSRTHLLGHVYDNINMVFKVAEAVVGRNDSQENGTCATVFPLYDAKDEDMQTKDLLASYESAPPLSVTDIMLTAEENRQLHDSLVHTVLRIIVAFGGQDFTRFKDDLVECTPVTSQQIPVHKTETYPLPAMNIDESSTVGNAEVIDTIFKELNYNTSANTKADSKVKIVCGDQLSIARVRSVTGNRVGHDSPRLSYLDVVCGPGLFHAQLHAVFGTLQTHWGNPHLGPRDPGSLCFHNSVLFRKPILLSSMPPYRTCRDLVFVSLYARVFHCLELVSGTSIAEYGKTVTFTQLKLHAAEIVDKYANAEKVQELRDARAREMRAEMADIDIGEAFTVARYREGDTVYENALLFFRDALLIREFTDAIKCGGSGRIVIVLKTLALFYRGTGRTKYAHEMLHLIHNVTQVWPKPLCAIMLKNWLVNPTGRENGFIPVDLLQEHMNFWIKTIYQAQGSAASWEWLQMVSPSVNVLRALATQMNGDLGSHQGSKHHSPDLSIDIQELMKSLRTHRVYCVEPGRTIDDGVPVPDVLVSGLHGLNKPLQDYNVTFERLRARRQVTPLVGEGFGSPLRPVNQDVPQTVQLVPTSAEDVGGISAASPGEYESESSFASDDEEAYLDAPDGNSDVDWHQGTSSDEDAGSECGRETGRAELEEDEADWRENYGAAERIFSFETAEDVDIDTY